MRTIFTLLFALLLNLVVMAQPITVTQPNGGEMLYGCQTYSIKWNASGVSNWYDIHYSLDGGTIWASVATNVNITNNQYAWSVPMVNSGTVLIRVLDHQAPAKRDSSNNNFTVQLPINITSPNGGEVWQGLSTHTIFWTPAGTSGVFNLYYSTDAGTNWTTIATNQTANNYTWTVPNTPSTNALVKVQDASTSCQMDISDAAFEISPATPILTAPNGGEVWTINSVRNITWNSATFHTNVKLEYSTDGGLNYNLITASTSNNGSYAWTIPNTPSTTVKVRASNASGSTVFDESNAVFTIQWPGNFLTSPIGGETWRSMNTHNITWNNSLFTSNVKLDYSLNNGTTWNNIASNVSNTGTYSWVIPAMETNTQVKVKITNLAWPFNISDTSHAAFTILAPITIDYPNLATTLTACSTVNIQWSRTTSFSNYNGNNSPASYCNYYELYYNVNGGPDNYITTVSNYQSQYSYSYSWVVPDVAPGNLKIKIVSRYNTYQTGTPGTLFRTDSSNVAAAIVDPSGNITVINPDGGVTMDALNNYNITWSSSGSSGFFDVFYSTNGGNSYTSLISNISGSNYLWNVNNTPSTNVLVKVRDNQNICRKDFSNSANIIVAATPKLLIPNGGEVWNVNSSHAITWQTNTFFANVGIEYSVDNGASWNTITASASNTGSYNWTVPNLPTTMALIKIYNVGSPANFDVSNAVFGIQIPVNFLTSPNGGETWRSMNTQSITWDATAFTANVKLEYSLNNGTSWSSISESVSNSGSYSWVLPQVLTTTQALVRITNNTVNTISDVSNAVFTIKAPVTVDYPDAATTLTGCSTVNIQWSRTTNFNNYNNYNSPNQYCNYYELYYNVNGGPDNYIATVYNGQTTYNYGYSWTVPDVTPGNVKIKVVSRYNTYQYSNPGPIFWTDSSDVAASTVDPSGTITVTSPDGGATLNALTNQTITWTSGGTSGFFDILYSTNNGNSYSTLATNVTGNSYQWNVNNTPSTDMLIKVRDNQNNCRKDISNASNTIVAATPILTAPNGGEVWKVNSSQNITWNTATIFGNVFIEFSTDNGATWNIVTASASNTGSFTWTVPNYITNQALIRISNVGFPLNSDVSNAVFSINLPSPVITSPNGGEMWRSQNTYNITWDQTTVASNVKLEYSVNNGSTWTVITTSTSNTGSYSWTIPQMLTTTQALIRATNTGFPTAVDTSNAVFTIKAPVTVDYPDAATTLTGCSSVNILWSRTTNFNNYNSYNSPNQYCNYYEVYYNVNGGPDNYITTVYNNQTTYSYGYTWTVPDVTPGKIKIKVVSRYNTYSYGSPGPIYWTDSSDVAATTVDPSGSIVVTSPNGGTTLNALTNHNITWTANGTSGFFDVLYSTNNGNSFSTIATNITGNSYAWNVNNTPGSNVLVKVRDNQNTCRKDVSDAVNTILAATPVLTSPNGGETWKVNSSQNITWNAATLFGNVLIEYSTDNGTSWNIVTASAPNTGTCTWIVPNYITSQALIRISNVDYPANNDVSNAAFTINLPTPILTSPNGGEVWRSMNTQNITWDQSTVASNVKLEYSINNGNTWNSITSSTSNTGSYSWTLPQVSTTTQALVRITNTSFPSAMDTSNAVFTIKAPVTVDFPDQATTLTGCSTINILWSRTTNFSNYNSYNSPNQYCNSYEIYYNVNGGPDNLITTVYNNQTTYNYGYTWTVPDVTPGNIKIKVVSRYNTYNYGTPAPTFWTDSSDFAASTVDPAGTITVLSPSGGVSMNALTNYNITWNASGTSGFFDVLYNYQGNNNFTTLATNITGNTYSWNVNNTPGNNVVIKVRDNQNTCRKNITSANTIVAATPVLTSPNGGETWYINNSYNITWNPATLFTNAMIEYSTDNGVNWNVVAASASNTGSLAWTVPNIITSQALIRISNAGYPSNYDVSNAVFNFQLPGSFLTSPNGGENWRSMNSHSITWNPNLFTSYVKLEYSINNGNTWSSITTSTSNSGSYSWSVPQMLTTTQALVRITNTTLPAISDVSDAVFTIKAPVTVDFPDAGTNLTGCSNVNIQWSRTTNFSNYNSYNSPNSYCNTYELYYNVDGGPDIYITTVYNNQTTYSYGYSWTVPDVAPGNIKVKVVSRYNTYQYSSPAPVFWTDSSDIASPAVDPSGTIVVTSPDGGVTLTGMTSHNVTWTANGTSGFFDILYSVNGGTSFSTIASNVAGNTYNWTVNNNPSTNVYVKVRDNQNTCRKDVSNQPNTILAATPILTAPNGGEVWNVNSTQNITWNPLSAYGNVFIEYSLDNGVTWNTVISSTSNTGSYSWTLPYTPSTQAKIRISNVGNPVLYDVSNAVFTILVPTPVVTSPNGGETWYAGEVKSITWLSSTFFSSTVNIDYSLDGGNSWTAIATNQSNSGTYSWTLPSLNSANALIRVSNYTNNSVYDVSNALLTLRPWVRVITPNGGDILGSCTQTSISFEKSPSYSAFNIEYSIDNGSNWVAIQTNATYNNTNNMYSWTIPNTPSTQTLVRVYPYGNVARGDQSDAVFTIRKAVSIIQPNYGGVLVTGTSYPVKWQSDGISNIYDLAFSTTGPTGPWTNIVLGYNTSLNTYNWNVPNTPTTNGYLRIRDNVSTCKEDISDMAFTIAGSANPITVTAPNGSDTLSACNTYNITWTESSSPVGNYNISYSIDYGNNWIPIATNYLTTNSVYNWIVPNINSSATLIRVQSGLNPLVYDFSNASFVIKPGKLTTNSDTTICAGNSVQLNTTGGTSYSWTPVTGLSNPTIANPIATPATTTQYIVSSTSSGCSLKDTVVIFVNNNTGLTASVTISPSTNTAICQGSLVVFTASANQGGILPAYQWKINGQNVGSNTYTYSTSSLNNGDVVTCVMTSSLQCVNNSPATSNAITMSVYPIVTPSVTISTPQTNICSGSSVIFSASAQNQGGSPVYQWKLNGVNVGTNSASFTSNQIQNNGVVSVQMTSNAICLTSSTVSSNSILMTVNPNLTPGVTISTPVTSVCAGSPVTFTAVATDAGTNPSYQWKVNGNNVGTNSPTFVSSTLSNNSSITCTVTSSYACNTTNPVTSAAIDMTITAPPAAPVASSNSPVPLHGIINLQASTITGATYTWTGPNGYVSVMQNPVINNALPSMSGTYSVVATINGCSSQPGNTTVVVSGTPPIVTISGMVQSETGQPIFNTKINLLSTPNDSVMTPLAGTYAFSVNQGSSCVIKPSKNNDVNVFNGITTLDVVMIQRHILNQQLLPTPYKIIAADVNGSSTVTNLDVLLIKSLILQNIESFPNSERWKFVNSDYVFPVPTNPFPFESTRSFSQAVDAIDQNFIGIKLGDVNNSWNPNIPKIYSPVSVEFNADEVHGLPGQIVEVPVTVKSFHHISGFQYTMTWNPLILEYISAGSSNLDVQFGEHQVNSGNLTALFSTENLNGTTLANETPVMVLKFRIIGQTGEISPISFNGQITSMETVNKELELLTMVTNDGKVMVDNGTGIENPGIEKGKEFTVTPNPFAEVTNLHFTVQKDSKVNLTIFDVYGNEVYRMVKNFKSGANDILWEGTGMNGMKLDNGTYYCRLESNEFRLVRKLVLIK